MAYPGREKMDNRRKHERKRSETFPEVYDRNTNQMVGRLHEYSTGGIMLTGTERLPENTVFQFKMNLPQPDGKEHIVNFDARSVWSEKHINPEYFNTGFQFINIAQADIEAISGLENIPCYKR
jgi:hypothetical protein